MTQKEYMDFMMNPENSHNCEKCPENREMDAWQSRKPCGQWNCWVDLLCKDQEGER